MPISVQCPAGADFAHAEAQLHAGASRVIIGVNDVVCAAVDFLTTGIASGESTIERLSR